MCDICTVMSVCDIYVMQVHDIRSVTFVCAMRDVMCVGELCIACM